MSAPPYMRLYWGDYFRDTRRLNRLEHSAYLLLLGELWIHGGKLPADDATLARATLCTADEWAEVRASVMSFFKVSRGHLTQKRLSAELAKYDDTIRKRKAAGKKGGSVSNGKHSENSQANANHLPTKPEPEPEPEPVVRTLDDKSSKAGEGISPDHDKLAWTTAKDLLTRQGGLTEKSAAAMFGKLLALNGLEARDMLASVVQAGVNGTQDPQGYLTKAAQAIARRRAPIERKAVGFV